MADEAVIAGKCDLRDGDGLSRANKACDFIASTCGLSYSTMSENDTYITKRYMFDSNVGLEFDFNKTITSSRSAASIYIVYREANDNFFRRGTSIGSVGFLGSGDFKDSSEEDVTLYGMRWDLGNSMYKFFRFKGIAQNFDFMPFSATDYFSGKTRSGFFTGLYFYMYNDSDKILETVTIDKIGGGSYPSKYRAASPAILKTDDFYGFINNSSSHLYHIPKRSYTYLNVGDKIQVNGVTFKALSVCGVNDLYIRS